MSQASRAGRGLGRAWGWLVAWLLAGPVVAVEFTTREAVFGVDERGLLASIRRRSDAREYLAAEPRAAVLSVRVEGTWRAPTAAAWDAGSGRWTFRYAEADVEVVVAAKARETHVRLEVVEVRPSEKVEMILWGPYPTRIGETIGEVIGVVRDAEFAVGLQALNAKTLGGFPGREDDIEAEFGADDTGRYGDLPAALAKGQHFRGDTARRTEFGSVLQAYCRNRDRERVIANWGHEKYVAPAFDDGGPVGSAVAWFGCAAGQALATIGEIEVAEGLPHPMLDGVWAKVSPAATSSYLIVDFGEHNVEQAIEMTRRAGLAYLYHSSPFATWGHFALKTALFPKGWDGLRECVEKGRRAGVRIGFHTLSNFITPNDAYVSPVPDPRLARIGSSTLAADVAVDARELPVAEPDYFRKPTTLNTVMIGGELVKYGSVTAEAPWRLLDCERGAWGTKASAHGKGVAVGRLMDHGYRVFLTDASLTQEVARNLARLCNHAGTMQISLDGLEGAWATGMGQYGRTLFAQTWYGALAPELRGQINDASNPGHYNWHSYTRMNWGEPWYAGFRESQTLYRFKNQLHFERNLMPRMLGWFALRADTSLEDAEWLLARAAGFDAGFALAASLASTAQLEADPDSAEAARAFGAVPAILAAIRNWETARMSKAFPPALRAAMRDNEREFHLETLGAAAWEVREVHRRRFTHDARRAEATEVRVSWAAADRPLTWILKSTAKEPVTGVRLRVGDRAVLDLRDTALPAGGTVSYRGGTAAVIADRSGKELGRVPVEPEALRVAGGEMAFGIGATVAKEGELRLEVGSYGPGARIEARR